MTDILFPYTALQLTGQVNRIPNLYGLLNDLDLFPSSGSISTLIEVRRDEHTLSVLPAVERGGPASVAERKRGDVLYFEVPHFPHLDMIGPRDLQNMLTVDGRAARPRTLEDEMAKRLRAIRSKHAITREWIRMGALKGNIVDGQDATLYNLFDAFGFTKVTIYFNLSSSTTDVDGLCSQLFEQIATNLRGEVMSHVEAIVSPAFFDAFIGHPKVQKYWLNWSNAEKLAQVDRQKVGGQMGRTFTYQKIIFREYYGVAPVKVSGSLVSKSFVTTGKGHAYPAGTLDTFYTYDAPPEDIRFVNEAPGQEVFISPKILDHGQGVELMTQSNQLAMVRRPEVLVELDSGAAP
ncbi:hypothetical protein M2321_003976 [Rhodoblastus acidophilus]|uniref:major capsid protein n=1 Tax=Rhodoblastus acidophilus TaxID=1074 RepID=UPI0018B05A8C|nr:major capsid protein [Rhodoblastus acidophilus]MCW2276371.1 hypothetical protein [Rhodoblastus acidophilus]